MRFNLFRLNFGSIYILILVAFVILLAFPSVSGQCAPLIAPPNGVVVSEGQCGVAVGSVCRVDCRNNCQLIGDAFHTCLPDNKWSGQESMCIDRTLRCRPRLNSPENGFIIGKCRNFGRKIKCTFKKSNAIFQQN